MKSYSMSSQRSGTNGVRKSSGQLANSYPRFIWRFAVKRCVCVCASLFCFHYTVFRL